MHDCKNEIVPVLEILKNVKTLLGGKVEVN
jgi:hypothetical protein